jgi:hypothetical protein
MNREVVDRSLCPRPAGWTNFEDRSAADHRPGIEARSFTALACRPKKIPRRIHTQVGTGIRSIRWRTLETMKARERPRLTGRRRGTQFISLPIRKLTGAAILRRAVKIAVAIANQWIRQHALGKLTQHRECPVRTLRRWRREPEDNTQAAIGDAIKVPFPVQNKSPDRRRSIRVVGERIKNGFRPGPALRSRPRQLEDDPVSQPACLCRAIQITGWIRHQRTLWVFPHPRRQ